MVHGVQVILDENATKEDWGFLLIDANNVFNKINQFDISVDGQTLMEIQSSFSL